MAAAIEDGAPPARVSDIGEWVAQMGQAELAARATMMAGIGRSSPAASVHAPANDSSTGILTAVKEPIAPPRSRRLALWIAAAAVVGIGVTGIVVLSRGEAKPADVAIPLTHVPVGTAVPAAVVPTADPAAEAERPSERADPLPATSSVTAKTPAAARTGPPTRAPGSKPRAGKALACDPPFTIDELGHKHYKVDCL